MVTWKSIRQTTLSLGGAALVSFVAIGNALAAPLNIKDSPLFLDETPPPLNMLVMSRDHRMYYEAYNDASDLNNDGVIDTGYKPDQIEYFGYFDSHICYSYGGGVFVPAGTTADKTCSGLWSGDWLNYVTTSRIDALRKVLYGGLRSTDNASTTVLQRAFIPQDAHSWGKEYESVARDGYDIGKYTPFGLPSPGTRHLFANTTPAGDAATTGNANAAINGVGLPKLRVLQSRNNRIWDWVSKERPVANNDIIGLDPGGVSPADYVVRVQVCTAAANETAKTDLNCKVYANGAIKPTGLLQDYGENDSMFFGLLTGSYGRPHDGGVLRREVSSVADEIDLATGQFMYGQDPPGIISTIDRLRITGFNGGSYSYNCGWITSSADAGGACSMWGNPTAEMMYEALRYYAGKGASNAVFSSGANNGEEASLGLKVATWDSNTNPYGAGKYPTCSKPFETVISDISPSYDSDTVPGSYFGGYSGDLTGLDASNLGNKIWSNEMAGVPGNRYFIGQSGGVYDGAPTVKTVNSFGNIRGLAPEAPAKEGSYNAASVAYHGLENDLNPANGEQKPQTFAVALASPLPSIEIPVAGRKITLVPFAKSVGGSGYGISPTQGQYQPTNQIVDFYVDTLTATYGKFRVNFEDVEQGADHDMDAISVYEYQVNAGGTVTVSVTSEYAAGGIIQHMGYVISGTTQDGAYLEVRDVDTSVAEDPDYFLDTPNGQSPPGQNYTDNTALPLAHARTFSPGTTAAASVLKDPLWYAAKWGGFKDSNGNGLPDARAEWASKAPAADTDPDPDNYFLVTNALRLKAQLAEAFDSILDRAGSASSASVSSGSISSDTRLYQATFESRRWSGELLAFPIADGTGGTVEGAIGAAVWSASTQIPAPAARRIITASATIAGGTTGVYRIGVPFQWGNIGAARQAQLDPLADGKGQVRLDYLRGDRTNEQPAVGGLRERSSALGDMINAAPIFVGAPPFRYPDGLESAAYSGFKATHLNRQKVVYAGANDGMMHAFDATTGVELFAFIPSSVFKNLYTLTDPAYAHRYFVDGTPSVIDAFFSGAWHTVLAAGLNKGGQGVYALDVTDPASITEASADATFLWEFTDAEDSDLGYTYSRPSIVKMENGKWAAVFGNGYNNTDTAGGADTNASATGNAALYVVDISNGQLIRKISIPVGAAQDPTGLARPNGLASPALIDVDGDNKFDTAYAGDLFGNLWKFNLSSADETTWDVAYKSGSVPLPLFVARNASNQRQPITERPNVGQGPLGIGYTVVFGTGKFLEPGDRDLANLQVQSFYGIFDKNTGTAASDIVLARSALQQQTILSETTVTFDGDPTNMRTTSSNVVDPASRSGWYIDLVSPAGFQGEMQVTDPVLRNDRVFFTTLIPDQDICAYGGSSWFMAMDMISGVSAQAFPGITGAGISHNAILQRPAILSGAKSDHGYIPGSDAENFDPPIEAGPAAIGRQSWRQLR
ncbi:MAG: PilC/PilY family type IV pilus protein [Pseudomonadota bacterium]